MRPRSFDQKVEPRVIPRTMTRRRGPGVRLSLARGLVLPASFSLELTFGRLDTDRGGAVVQHVEFLRRRLRKVDFPTADVGAAIVDLDFDLLAVLQIGYRCFGAERQLAMRRAVSSF